MRHPRSFTIQSQSNAARKSYLRAWWYSHRQSLNRQMEKPHSVREIPKRYLRRLADTLRRVFVANPRWPWRMFASMDAASSSVPDVPTSFYSDQKPERMRVKNRSLLSTEIRERLLGRGVVPAERAIALKRRFREACYDRLIEFLSVERRIRLETSETPEVSIIIVLHNSAELTFEHLKSLERGDL